MFVRGVVAGRQKWLESFYDLRLSSDQSMATKALWYILEIFYLLAKLFNIMVIVSPAKER